MIDDYELSYNSVQRLNALKKDNDFILDFIWNLPDSAEPGDEEWMEAFKKTCESHNKMTLYNYYASLGFSESTAFSYTIEEFIEEN